MSGTEIEAEKGGTQQLPVWTLRRAISNPALLAIAGITPGAIAVTNAWIVTKRSPDLTLSILGAIPIGNLVASTAAPVLALLAVAVLGASALRGIRLSPALFWICASLATFACPLLAVPLIASLAIASYATSFDDRTGQRVGQFLQRLHSGSTIYVAAASTLLPGVIALGIRDAYYRDVQTVRALTFETVGGVLVVLTVAILLLASAREIHRALRREGQAIGMLLLALFFMGSLWFAASNLTWGPREAISWTTGTGEVSSVGRVVSVDDTGVQMMDDRGFLSFIDGNEITDRVVCPQPIDLSTGSSVVEVFGLLLDGADYRAYDNPLCS